MDSPRILIIGVGRSGTTTLIKALGTLLKLKQCNEPWNREVRQGRDIAENSVINDFQIVKTLIGHTPLPYSKKLSKDVYWDKCVDFYQKFISNYDNVILLSRRNRKDIALSDAYQRQYGTLQTWHNSYIAVPEDKLKLNMEHTNNACNAIEKLSGLINIPITWYEDLYSGDHKKISDSIQQWGLEVGVEDLYTYIDPKNRYRREHKRTTI